MLLFSFIWLLCSLLPQSDIIDLQFLRHSHTNTYAHTEGMERTQLLYNAVGRLYKKHTQEKYTLISDTQIYTVLDLYIDIYN